MDVDLNAARRAGDVVLDELVGPAVPTEVIRDGGALVLRRGSVLVRVRPAADAAAVAHRELQLTATLADVGVPVTEAVTPDEQPWVVGASVVTAWRWTGGGPPVTDADLGRLARLLRERTGTGASVTRDPALTVPAFDPIEFILHAVAGHPDDDPEAGFVRDRAAELATAWADVDGDDPLGHGIVHGDLHRGNVVSGPDGPLLTDLELSGAGPLSYDAARAVVAVSRYGEDPASLDAFLAAFGAEPRSWPSFATCVGIYELQVTAWAVGVRDRDPSWAGEASRRVATLRDGDDHAWVLR
ncbi:MAG: aminoglycoside phosphotransferase [Acidimicrobiales bacterium]|nr:aminoglycoside phosphotransferase [Acidimicrobiales bacterium]